MFSIFHTKNTQISYFWYQIKEFLFFHQSLQLDKFEGVDLEYDTSLFQFQFQNSKERNF